MSADYKPNSSVVLKNTYVYNNISLTCKLKFINAQVNCLIYVHLNYGIEHYVNPNGDKDTAMYISATTKDSLKLLISTTNVFLCFFFVLDIYSKVLSVYLSSIS